jgi:hypothetical protein
MLSLFYRPVVLLCLLRRLQACLQRSSVCFERWRSISSVVNSVTSSQIEFTTDPNNRAFERLR